MDNIFIISGVISIIFTLFKFLEMRIMDVEHKKPLKYLVRDSLLVYFSVVVGSFIIDQVSPSINDIVSHQQPAIFSSEPDF